MPKCQDILGKLLMQFDNTSAFQRQKIHQKNFIITVNVNSFY